MKQLKIFLLSFLLPFCSIAQLTLGEATLSYAKAKPLLRSESIITAVKNVRYLSKVGGVAFDKVAQPEDGLAVNNLQLQYNSLQEDGKRFSVNINGSPSAIPLYDWELVPIAKYANSIHNACFTLFGDLDDSSKAYSIREEGGKVLNYHPELANTLLGLRLFQLDILIIEPALSTDLPKQANKYILGNGEKKPDIQLNKSGYQKFAAVFNKGAEKYSSYLICDKGQTIKFRIRDNSLAITGQPFYHFWKFNTETSSFRESLALQLTTDEALIRKPGRTESEKNSLLENWLLKNIRTEYRKLPAFNESAFNTLIRELKETRTSEGAAKYLEELEYTLFALRIENTPKTVVYLNTLSSSSATQSDVFRSINPAVWDAGVKTMRYSAFFRYCKEKFPDEWKTFMAQVKRINIAPAVTTPTVMKFN